MELLAGTTIDHYRVLERLGFGAMGDVYRAEDLRLRRTVALKTLRAEPDHTECTARLLAEARAAASLSPPHSAVVSEIGQAALGAESIATSPMEYVAGLALSAVTAERRLDLDVVPGI